MTAIDGGPESLKGNLQSKVRFRAMLCIARRHLWAERLLLPVLPGIVLRSHVSWLIRRMRQRKAADAPSPMLIDEVAHDCLQLLRSGLYNPKNGDRVLLECIFCCIDGLCKSK